MAQIASVGRMSRRQYFDKIKRNKPIRDRRRAVPGIGGGRACDALQPLPQRTSSDVKRENQICEDTAMIGVSADMASIRDIVVVDGRFFTAQEDRSRAFVAVIGDTVRNTLFPPDSSPVGKTIRIEGIEFTVVGVQERLGSSFGRDAGQLDVHSRHGLRRACRARAPDSRCSAAPGRGWG